MTPQELQTEQYKRNIACKLKIGSILTGKPIIENDRLHFLEIRDKKVSRVNLVANITDKFIQEGEKKFGSITLDDASGQIKVKVFGEEIDRFKDLNQGDTVLLVGLLRHWNNEIYLSPEILKKIPVQYLLIRKLETDLDTPKEVSQGKLNELKDKILQMIKKSESEPNPSGLDIDKIILELHESPDTINSEIKKLLEEGQIYEPRPGKLRYLG